MKKALLMMFVLLLCGCVKAGEFSAKRQRLHNMGAEHETNFCEQHPDKCINGVPW